MDVVILLVFISLGLVAASLLFFVHRLREGDFDHAERLALAPLDDDPPPISTDDGAADATGTDTPSLRAEAQLPAPGSHRLAPGSGGFDIPGALRSVPSSRSFVLDPLRPGSGSCASDAQSQSQPDDSSTLEPQGGSTYDRR